MTILGIGLGRAAPELLLVGDERVANVRALAVPGGPATEGTSLLRGNA
jgi:hypothetical protein